MACTITSITAPTSSSVFDPGEQITVTWVRNNMMQCLLYDVLTIKLYEDGVFHSTLFSGSPPCNVNNLSKTVTLPSSNLDYGDVYKIRIEYDYVP
ncbi:MAG: hypothetical protein CMB80_00230 [Flammeovirgaceae bacterium]|nr:hypothetical protein [Flammeovirgaceae bacterium]|tara:strand:- start:632 stop:916 length:285 start_codon:yes stop_codon:yes gene_type:complete